MVILSYELHQYRIMEYYVCYTASSIGLTGYGLDLLQRHIDITSDLQTVALVVARCVVENQTVYATATATTTGGKLS